MSYAAKALTLVENSESFQHPLERPLRIEDLERPLRIEDIVRLNNGGPNTMIVGIAENNEITAVWRALGGRARESLFPSEYVHRVSQI